MCVLVYVSASVCKCVHQCAFVCVCWYMFVGMCVCGMCTDTGMQLSDCHSVVRGHVAVVLILHFVLKAGSSFFCLFTSYSRNLPTLPPSELRQQAQL